MSRKPRIGITTGDPNGIGPEVVLKSVNDPRIESLCEPVIYGTEKVLRKATLSTGLCIGSEIAYKDDFRDFEISPGSSCAEAGKVSLFYIEQAVKDVLNKKTDAIVTAPISKESIRLAGSKYSGHTDMLKELTGAKDAVMLFDGGPFRVALVTIHVALSEVPSLITKENVLNVIKVCSRELKRKFHVPDPRIVVCGLNPHAGEAGAFGREDIEEIEPAVGAAEKEGIKVEGPLPADTVFYYASRGVCDLVIAMYHDQGLAPFKMLAFDSGVNVTLGLPVVRTSPDHGTAFDIAWKGIAKPESMINSIRLAVELLR